MQLHLAQLNVATLRQPIDHPDTVGFADRHRARGRQLLPLALTRGSAGGGGFFIAYLDGAPLACGAYRRIEGTLDATTNPTVGAAEVERMWAHPDSRGSKLGAAILATIIQAATADGYHELKLETGEHLTAAVGLYTKAGFVQCEPWREYADSWSSQEN